MSYTISNCLATGLLICVSCSTSEKSEASSKEAICLYLNDSLHNCISNFVSVNVNYNYYQAHIRRFACPRCEISCKHILLTLSAHKFKSNSKLVSDIQTNMIYYTQVNKKIKVSIFNEYDYWYNNHYLKLTYVEKLLKKYSRESVELKLVLKVLDEPDENNILVYKVIPLDSIVPPPQKGKAYFQKP